MTKFQGIQTKSKQIGNIFWREIKTGILYKSRLKITDKEKNLKQGVDQVLVCTDILQTNE